MTVSIRHALLTLWLSIQFTPYFTGRNIIQIVLGLILLLYLMASKTRLENALSFTFWERIFARVCSDKSSFFIPSFRHQDSNSYYFLVATAKIPKLWKRTSLDVGFLTSRSQDRAISCQWIIQPKPIDCLYDTFLKFRNAPQTPIQLKGLMTTGWKVSKYGPEETPYLDSVFVFEETPYFSYSGLLETCLSKSQYSERKLSIKHWSLHKFSFGSNRVIQTLSRCHFY